MGVSKVNPEDIWDERGLAAGFLLMDVRTPAEFREAHIPGSVNIPMGDIEHQLAAIRERSTGGMAIVCHTWIRSQVVYDELQRLGIEDAAVLRGGVDGWVRKGLPVVRDEKGISLQRQVQIGAGSLTLIGILLGAFVSPWFLLLSAAIGAGLVHAGVTDTCAFAILLSKLPFNRRADDAATLSPPTAVLSAARKSKA